MNAAGCDLLWGDAPDPTTEFDCLREMGFPNAKRGKTDATCLADTDKVKKFASGFLEEGPIKFRAVYSHAEYAALLADFRAGTDLYWNLKFPVEPGEINPSHFTFRGWIEEMKPEDVKAGADDQLEYEFSVMPHDVSFVEGS